MATRRPDLLEHALGQVARQRGVDRLELVLAPHGFEPDPGRSWPRRATASTVQVVPQPAEDASSATCCNAAADGRVTATWCSRWTTTTGTPPTWSPTCCSPAAYSGAELVGMPDDVYYLEPTDETVRLGQPSEVYRQFVAGGTLMVDRGLLHEVGGFRTVRRHVDAELIAAVRAAGGATYRTHGLGYVLRRTDAGHTWQADLDDLRARAAQVTPGFRARTAHGAVTPSAHRRGGVPTRSGRQWPGAPCRAAEPYDHGHAPAYRPRRPAPRPGPAGGLRAAGRQQRRHRDRRHHHARATPSERPATSRPSRPRRPAPRA